MKYSRRFSLEERKQILAEYESGNFSQKELAFKYGIASPCLISIWAKRLSESKKGVPLPVEKSVLPQIEAVHQSQTLMAKKETKSPEEEIVELRSQLLQAKRALDWEKKRSLALETLIEVAEEHGMPVKKCGARQ